MHLENCFISLELGIVVIVERGSENVTSWICEELFFSYPLAFLSHPLKLSNYSRFARHLESEYFSHSK
jgi:hypothetical protein